LRKAQMKTNSATLRALMAPSDSAVCPLSRTIRNLEGWHAGLTGFGSFKLAGPRAADFTLWGFGEVARLAEVPCFGEATCAGDLLCFDEPLMMSDSQPASPDSIGRCTDEAITATTIRLRDQTQKPESANFSLTKAIPTFPRSDFLFALHGSTGRH
jgi:hypothetical protein